MRFVLGGEGVELTKEEVERATRRLPPEPIRTHLVEIAGAVYPPKQVFAAATGRARQSFTTQDAQRVLTRLGFVCRRADARGGVPVWEETTGEAEDLRTLEGRLESLELALATAQVAIAGLHQRLESLERNKE